jgi:hypothetical protein
VQNYDNAITQARLQNSSVLAEIAYEALQKELELSLQGFQYKNTLLIEKANKKTEVDNMYYQRYQDVLSQINRENAMDLEMRMFEKEMQEKQRQFNATYDLQEREFEEQQRQFNKLHASNGSGGSGGQVKGGSKKKSSGGATTSATKKVVDKTVNKVTNNVKKQEKEINMKNVLDLGYGPISGAQLGKLVNEGKVVQREKGNKITFRRVDNWSLK